MSDYEIGVYNKHVRETIRSGDDWDEEQSGISKDFEKYILFKSIFIPIPIASVATKKSTSPD